MQSRVACRSSFVVRVGRERGTHRIDEERGRNVKKCESQRQDSDEYPSAKRAADLRAQTCSLATRPGLPYLRMTPIDYVNGNGPALILIQFDAQSGV